MKCPYCNDDMLSGYVQSGRDIIWGKNKHKLSFLPDKKNGDIEIATANLMGAYQPAFCCKNCKKIIVEY